MKKILLISWLLLTNVTFSQQNNTDILVGNWSVATLQYPPFSEWYAPNYKAYTPDAKILQQIKKHSKDITITIVMGTWCGDSQLQVPHFMAIADKLGWKNNIETIFVNRSKTTPDGLEKKLNITNVPTIIFYKKGKEINRIVESPRETLEKDIYKIVKGEAYKHIYLQ